MASKKKSKPRAGRRGGSKRQPRAPRPQRRQPETLRLRRMTAAYTVNDLLRSLAWYCDVLGFIEGERWKENGQLRGVQLKAGSCELFLSQDDFAKGRDRPKGVGFRLYCTTVQDIDRLMADIRARGGTIAQGPTEGHRGQRHIAVVDPDGFKIAIAQER